ncbi:hypothetical protein [Gallaecimonas mangrovi]|uniref:hypothetical protein n=1 Tax=Gallaecimonas mangrovi TaxID=2291597 RepID=UPI00126028D8|nr:hypothetical protein [Gallaecimonas mangrovi]
MSLSSWPMWLRYRVYAAMLAILFAAAFISEAGQAAGPWHVQLHLLTFFVVALVSCWAWPKLHLKWQLLMAVLVPVIHEVCEMFGHGHRLEYRDIAIDVAGGFIGIALAAFFKRKSAA